jgi:hypothetical protein
MNYGIFVIMSECLRRKLLENMAAKIAKEVINLQRIIEDYIMLIQIRIKKNEIKAASGQVTIPSIKLTCEMNDIMLINLVHKSTSRVNAAVQYKQYRTMDTLTSLTTPSVIEFPD